MNKFVALIITIITYTYSPICWAKIITTNSFEKLECILSGADRETLVIFDVDEVLIRSMDAAMHPKNKDFLKKRIKNSSQDTSILWSIILRDQKLQLVDQKMSSTIKTMQEKGVPMYALTAINIGPHGFIKNAEEWRYQQLKAVGIFFRTAKEHGSDILPLPLAGTGYYKGLIASGIHPKGDVLKTFMDQYPFSDPYTRKVKKIKTIIFVDDNLQQVESVDNFATKNGFKSLCVHYTAVNDRPYKEFKETRAILQFEILEKDHKWISDEEVDMQL